VTQPPHLPIEAAGVFLQFIGRLDTPEFEHEWRLFQNVAESCADYQSFVANCPPHSDERAAVVRVLRWYDTAGALIRRGVFPEDLFFELAPSTGDVWRQLDPWLAGMRSENSQALTSVEWLAGRYDAWRAGRFGG
jgi:hypothetical protein